MRKLCIRILLSAGMVASLLVTGCAGTGTQQTEELGVKTEKTQPAIIISPEGRKDYDAALEAIRAGNNGKAIALLTSLSQAYPDLSGPYTNLGLLYFHDGKLDKAEEAFNEAIKVNPQSAVSYNHLGIINRGKGNFKQAQTYYESALKIDDNYAYSHLNYAILLDLYLGQLDLALKHYERFQELNKSEDKEVEKWIADLQNRIKKAK